MPNICDLYAVTVTIRCRELPTVEGARACLARTETLQPVLHVVGMPKPNLAPRAPIWVGADLAVGDVSSLQACLWIGFEDLTYTTGVRTALGSPACISFLSEEDVAAAAAVALMVQLGLSGLGDGVLALAIRAQAHALSPSQKRKCGMNGLGGLNKSSSGVVIGLVQAQLVQVDTPADLARQTEKIVATVAKARRNLGTMDLVVFPEYALHGLSMNTDPAIMCRMDGPEVAAFRKACADNRTWGCFSIMEVNPHGNPYNVGLVIDDAGSMRLYYRKMHPWVPVEPWEPGDLGIPVIEGPRGCKLALIICHDGMFPEMARECTYKGAEIMLRTAGYTAPIRDSWRFTNQANAFQNLMVTANVCMCGSDGTFDSMGEGMIVNFDGTVIAHGTAGRADEIITAEVRPDLVREARVNWGVENNIYQLGHRGYSAVKGGAGDCPYTYIHDLVAGRYRLPWEDEVKVTDGTGCGLPAPTRVYAPGHKEAAE